MTDDMTHFSQEDLSIQAKTQYITFLGQSNYGYDFKYKHKKTRRVKLMSKRRHIQKFKLRVKKEFIGHYKYFDRFFFNILYDEIKLHCSPDWKYQNKLINMKFDEFFASQ